MRTDLGDRLPDDERGGRRAPQASLPRPGRTVEVSAGFLTRFERGPLRAAGADLQWMSGAAYDGRGRLVPESQRDWDGDVYAPIAADAEAYTYPDRARLLEGHRQYAGHWTQHFGHFLVETFPNLWPAGTADGPDPVVGLVAHRSCYGPAHKAPGQGDGTREATLWPWQRDLLDLAGYRGLPVEVVRAQHLRVERLTVPTRPLLLKSWVGEEAVALWRRVAARLAPGSSTRVFLSRARFHAAHQDNSEKMRVEAHWDAELERRFGAAGFAVVHPETLSMREQVALARGAEVLAGSAGSALHLSVFAEPGTTVVEVGDLRTPSSPLPHQQILDVACGHRSVFVPYRAAEQLAATLASL